MASHTTNSLLSTCFVLSLLISIAKAQPSAEYPYSVCLRTSNYTQGSKFQSNLNTTLSSLSSNIPSNGLKTNSSGTNPDTVYGLLQCRGDVSIGDCTICAQNVPLVLLERCPYQKKAVVFDDRCMIHYADNPFFSTPSLERAATYVNTQPVPTNPALFKSQTKALMDNLTEQATSVPSLFATGVTNFTESDSIYGLVQCTRDLSNTDCTRCLKEMIANIPSGRTTPQGVRILSTTCIIRYELYSFFESPPVPPLPPSTSGPPPVGNSPIPPTTNTTTNPYRTCIGTSNYTQGSRFQSNLNTTLYSLSSNIPSNGLKKNISGTNPDTVYGLLQCRGDVSIGDCTICAQNAPLVLFERCPYGKRAVIFDDRCMIHYADNPFFSTLSLAPLPRDVNTQPVSTNPALFTIQLDLMGSLATKAASDPSLFATGVTNFTESDKIYGLVQCTKDLSNNECSRCLQEMIRAIPYQGASVLSTSCMVRYETYPFFESPSPPRPMGNSLPPPRTNTTPTRSRTNGDARKPKISVIIIVIITLAVATIVLSCWGYCYISKKKKGWQIFDRVKPKGGGNKDELELPLFDLVTISAATNNFSEENKLGQGGYGPVFKGKLAEGQEIAAKRLSKKSLQGPDEFKNEILLISKLQHKNLVRLLGCCIQSEEKMLIYEYMPNRSLDYYIFDKIRSKILGWQKRFHIIMGIARGLLYLHHDSRLKIIHRDLKTSNILLDIDMDPKISDFGLARIFGRDQIEANTNRVVGTHGYMSPEYAGYGHFSLKSDVFSFGVMVLEILSGKKNRGGHHDDHLLNLLGHAWRLWNEGKAVDLVDESMENSYVLQEVLRCFHTGLLCVQQSPQQRPTMSSVFMMLSRDDMVLPQPQPPGFYVEMIPTESDTCISNKESFTLNEISNTLLGR